MSDTPKVLERYQLQPLQTTYAGIKYRSRSEARWAVFFDSLNLAYSYEMEGFDLGADVLYLPDFWLPALDAWLEVKGGEPIDDECEKAHRLSVASGKPVYVFFGGMANPLSDAGPVTCYAFFPDGSADHGFLWCECSVCGTLGIEFEGRSDRLPCKARLGSLGVCGTSAHGDKGYNHKSPRLVAAFDRARSARFGR